jgi:hypothetical protein
LLWMKSKELPTEKPFHLQTMRHTSATKPE